MQENPDFVTALARGLSILSCFQASDAELGNGDIAHRTGLAPATVARLTYTLTRLGYLHAIPRRRKYALSAHVLSMAYPVLAALPERELARTHVKRLADETGGSVCLAIADGLRAVYVEVSRGSDAGQYPDIGMHRPLLDSSVGRALYVAMDPAQRQSVLNRLCVMDPARADALREAAREAMDDFRQFGVCLSEGLVIPGWSAIAIPVSGLQGRTFAMSLGLPSAALPQGQLLRVAGTALTAAAARVAQAFRAGPARRRPGCIATLQVPDAFRLTEEQPATVDARTIR